MVEPLAPALFDSTQGTQEEAPSQALIPILNQTVLFVCRASTEIESVCSNLLEQGIHLILVQSVDLAPPSATAPRHCFLDWSLPGAPEYLSALTSEPKELWPVALVETAGESALAYANGAVSTVRKPLCAQEIISCLRGHRTRCARRVVDEAVLVHDQRVTAASAFESVIRTLGQELRTPLATALANVEYFAEEANCAASPLLDPEQQALLTDTLEAMQRLRSTLEGMSVLLPRDPPVLEQVRLWRVAQRVVDALPSGAQLVELRGEPGIRGWGDEATLVDLVSILVRRALLRQPKLDGPTVSLHVYAHDTEARITVRERPLPVSHEKKADDPFTAVVLGTATEHSGLQLATARHAIVKMGGLLSYISHETAGCAFRVRLRLAPQFS